MEYEVGLTFSAMMTRMKVEQWIHNMEEHMESNKVRSFHMVRYVVKHFEEETATWWTMHQAVNEQRKKITWKEFTNILLGSRLVTPMKRMIKRKRPRACKICGEVGHSYEGHQDGCPY